MSSDAVINLDIDGETEASGENWWIASQSEEQRAELKERNLYWLKNKYYRVYSDLVAFKPKSELVFGADGQPDMKFAGTLFYDGEIEKFTRKQLDKYWKNPNRLNLGAPTPQTLDNRAGKFLYSCLTRLQEEAEVQFSVGRSSGQSFYAFVMGIGLGRHLPEFIQKTKCRNLFILEPNLEGFYHSLELLDWAAILEEFQKRNGDVFFYVGGSTQNWMDGLRLQTRGTNVTSIDGTYVYSHYNNSIFAEFSKKFNKESQFLLTGLGFFYDEQIMLRNTYANMSGRNSRIYKRPDSGVVHEIPVIIVGCGPSLDHNIEDIKRNADNAVIMSCGSALGPLMDAGIRPDFQLELENIAVMRVMEYAAEKHDLSGICLVASSTVERKIKDFFDDVVYYFRPALSPYPIFSNEPESCLKHLDPTVVNVGLSFAQEVGFREFYFFGTDMGQKDSDQHHAKSSFHYSDKAKNEKLQVFNVEIPGNFGGKALTSSGLFWALDTLQRAILYSGRHLKYFNCSNGAQIEGAKPKLSRTLELPSPKISRADTVRAIMEDFPAMTPEEFADRWQPEKLVGAMNDMIDELVDIVETHDLAEETDQLIELARIFYQDTHDVHRDYARLVLRGSVNQVFIAIDYYLGRITDENVYDDAVRITREEVVKFLEAMREAGTKNIWAIDRGLELSDDYLRGATDDDGLTDEERSKLRSVI
ncbi:MAG: hypothetical protein COW30_06600 [Rhodospirillales bacterium CG15_BIG_FIL_POST_REV_8_21_14_020_66_15]|nr:MAG: hypothetical protein COW30_06600 [Rhodospirillales bacterium CG15_BIG_FIL_POST_REV_8_21_14_020_66_15]